VRRQPPQTFLGSLGYVLTAPFAWLFRLLFPKRRRKPRAWKRYSKPLD